MGSLPMTESPTTAAPARSALPWLWLSVVLFALDQWTKQIALTSLVERAPPIPFIDGFWSWSLVFNKGASFSLGANLGDIGPPLFITLALVISTVLTWWLRKTPRADWRTALPFALVIAGAIGNVVDRFRFGKVVDFILWYWRDFHWPVFNVADTCIVVGAVLLVLFSFRRAPAASGG